MSAWCEDQAIVTDTAKLLARRAMAPGNDGPSVETIWRALRPDTRDHYRDQARELLFEIEWCVKRRRGAIL